MHSGALCETFRNYILYQNSAITLIYYIYDGTENKVNLELCICIRTIMRLFRTLTIWLCAKRIYTRSAKKNP